MNIINVMEGAYSWIYNGILRNTCSCGGCRKTETELKVGNTYKVDSEYSCGGVTMFLPLENGDRLVIKVKEFTVVGIAPPPKIL